MDLRFRGRVEGWKTNEVVAVAIVVGGGVSSVLIQMASTLCSKQSAKLSVVLSEAAVMSRSRLSNDESNLHRRARERPPVSVDRANRFLFYSGLP